MLHSSEINEISKALAQDRGKYKDLSGLKFGQWIVLNRGPNSKNKKTRFFCRCTCDKEFLLHSSSLTSGKSTCCMKCSTKNRSCYHGKSNTKTYYTYIQMIERCHNQNHKFFKWYGEKGISVCDRWRDGFKNFLVDMGEAPQGLSIDRIDNSKGYFKDNCKWSTRREQDCNKLNSIKTGEIQNGWKFIDRLEIAKNILIQCIFCGVIIQISSNNFRIKKQCVCQRGKI